MSWQKVHRSSDGRLTRCRAELFARFEEEIRREYAWVEEAAYVAGRAAVLRGFAARPFIYGTPLFRARYEARARANLAASLEKLGVR